MMEIAFEKTKKPKPKPSDSSLGFGQHFTDHMFVMDYEEGKGWYNPQIVPYGDIPMSPASMVLHYGQAVFEGLKAYRSPDGNILLFRPMDNIKRLNLSNDRLCIPQIDENFVLQAIKTLVSVEKDFIPQAKDTSLYIRPFIIATDPFVGVRPSLTYKFMCILSPVGAYYPEGLDPVKIYVETKYVRAVKGGMGFAKTAGNYASSIKAQMEAKALGYTQVLWLDGIHRKYIEEVGTMNVFFKIDGKIITPALDGSILGGITRDSAISMLRSYGFEVSETRISIDELYECAQNGSLEEAFGTGTAAVISPIGEFNWNNKIIQVASGKIGELSQKLYNDLTDIQNGRKEDPFNWTLRVD